MRILIFSLVLAAGASVAGSISPISDIMQVRNPAGVVIAQVIATEQDEIDRGDPAIFYLPGIPIDISQLGKHKTLWDADPSDTQDIFGIAALGPDTYSLAFASAIDGVAFLYGSVVGPGGHYKEVEGQWYDMTQYLHPSLQSLGYTARFVSGEPVPEPGSTLLLGGGLLALVLRRNRRWIRVFQSFVDCSITAPER